MNLKFIKELKCFKLVAIGKRNKREKSESTPAAGERGNIVWSFNRDTCLVHLRTH